MESIQKEKTKKTSYKSRDWDQLKKEWLASGETKASFLRRLSIPLNSVATKSATREWVEELKLAHTTLARAYLAEVGNSKIYDIVDLIPAEVELGSWASILSLRSKQAIKDYQSAELLRAHCDLILSKSLGAESVDESEVDSTSLSPSNLRAIAATMESIQKVQRLSLGMSTDNVGADTLKSEEGAVDDSEKNTPVFEIQMKKNGKFTSVRPLLAKS